MSDRELLERAAMAAGVKYEARYIEPANTPLRGLLQPATAANTPAEWWNPLTDDGDALRLAVKCGICFGPNLDGDMAVAYGNDGNNRVEDHGTDPYAATRRAIVRAAAAMDDTK